MAKSSKKKPKLAKCPNCGHELNTGSLLRSIKSKVRDEASRVNGAKGGRPKGSKTKKKATVGK